MSSGELGDSALAFSGEMPAGASLFQETFLAELGEVVADGGFIPIGEHVVNGIRCGCGAHLLKVGDGDQDVVAAISDDFSLHDLEAIGCEAIEKFSGDVTAELVNDPPGALRAIVGDGFNTELIDRVGDLVDVLVAACSTDALALGVA